MVDTVLYPVAFLLATRFFIPRLGEKMFGLYLLCFSILYSLQVLNLGLGTATLRNVARFFHAGDDKRVNQTINTNLSIALFLFFICTCAGVVISLLVKYAGLFDIEPGLKLYAAACIFVAALIGGLKFCEQIIQFSFKGFERFDIAAQFNIVVRIGILVVNILIVWQGYSVMSMLLINLTITFTMMIVQLFTFKRIFPAYSFELNYSRERIREEMNFGVWIWLQSIVMIIAFQTDRYVVAYIGLDTLSYYGLTATIFNHIYMILGSLAPWLFPRIAGMRERNEEVVSLYKTIQACVVTFSIMSLAAFYLIRQPLLTLWLGPDKFLKLDRYIPLFTGFQMFFILTIVPISFLNAAGHERLSFKVNLALSLLTVIGILGCYALTHSAQGVIIGLILGSALSMPLMHYWIYTITGRGPRSPEGSLNKSPQKLFYEVFLTSLPSLAGLLLVISTDWLQRGLCLALMALTLRFVYFTKDNFDIKWLKQ